MAYSRRKMDPVGKAGEETEYGGKVICGNT